MVSAVLYCTGTYGFILSFSAAVVSVNIPMAERRAAKKRRIPGEEPLPQRAAALAARKMRSAADLRKKLIGEGYDADAVDAAISRLKEVYLLDDARMAQAVGRQYKDRGNRFITQKLREKGIAADHEISALEDLPAETERALAAGEKKLRSLQGVEPRAQAQKLYQHLALRGFGGSVIQKAVRQLTGTREEN